MRMRPTLALAAAGLAVTGLALAACSSSSDSASSSTAAAASTAASGANVLPPIMVDPTQTSVTAKVGDTIVFNVAKPVGTTAVANPEGIVTTSDGRTDGSADFNPGAVAVAEGTTEVTLTSTDGTVQKVTVTVTNASAAANGSADPAMVALCEQMVSGGMSPEDATALAKSKGYVARTGTIDGQPQAVTMDYRTDRFTFEVTGGKVTACTYG
jgi:hypothetical protein